MMKLNLTRTVPLLFSAALLVACGGGGGGGGGATPSVGGSTGPVYVPDDCTDTVFNEYLPLAVKTSINYNDSSSGQVDCDSTLTASENRDIYSIAYVYAGQPLTFYISSTADSILLWGIDGPIEVSDSPSIKVNKLRFDTPIVIRDGSTTGTGSTNASAQIGVFPIGNISVNYDRLEIDSIYPQTYFFGDGELPVKSVTLVTTIDHSSLNNPVVLTTTFQFAKGLGIVKHQGTYVFSVDSKIDSVTGLPEPIWFNYSGSGDPAQTSASALFSINGEEISPSEYTLVNGDDINALGWITVAENLSSTGYEVAMQYDSALDSVILPYSVEVIFENIATGEHLSANVTLTE